MLLAETVKEQCCQFFNYLLELSLRQSKATEHNMRKLIQELVDTKVEPEEFYDRQKRLLNVSLQLNTIEFLKVTNNYVQWKSRLVNTNLRHIITCLSSALINKS